MEIDKMGIIDLTKKAQVVLEKKAIFGEKAHVKFVIDISGSMSSQYSNGIVQELTDRLLGIGINLDEDQSIEVYAFGEGDYEIGSADINNHQGFIKNILLKKVRLEGDTRYAGAMKRIINKYSAPKKGFFKKTTVTASVPVYVIFVTDGNNNDQAAAEKLIRESSNQAIFWQFVGIGGARFDFLRKLDDMSGRFLDNADFFEVQDLRKISDEDLYDKLLTEFPNWLKQAREKGILN
jgi:uncharacterized protein YegL